VTRRIEYEICSKLNSAFRKLDSVRVRRWPIFGSSLLLSKLENEISAWGMSRKLLLSSGSVLARDIFLFDGLVGSLVGGPAGKFGKTELGPLENEILLTEAAGEKCIKLFEEPGTGGLVFESGNKPGFDFAGELRSAESREESPIVAIK